MKRILLHSLPLTAAVAFLVANTAAAQTAPAQTAPVPSTETAAASASSPEVIPSFATTKSARTRAGATGEYRISREDTISITCLNASEYSVVATVLPDGTISYPKMGQVLVAGKTLKQVEGQISKFLKKEFVRPQVYASVRERQIRQVSIIGTGVKQTGKRPMRDGWTVRDAISDAGGLLSDRTDLFTATLIRTETAERIPLDLVAVFNTDTEAGNPFLEPGDTLVVDASEESKSQVQVAGEVTRPGFVLIPRDRTISKALDAAGGFKTTALLSEVIVERNGEKIPVDMRQYVKDGSEPALRLLPGDRLVIPENKRIIYLMGAFGRQGATLLPDDRPMKLTQALADGNVPMNMAETKMTQVIRTDPATGKQVATKVDVEKLFKKGEYEKDILLQPGDIVYVPYKGGRKLGIGEITNATWGIVQARSLFSPSFWRF